MFAFKNKYFLIIESIKDINLVNIKKFNKFIIIYRYQGKTENTSELIKFRKLCRLKKIKFFVANNLNLTIKLRADGIYLSAYNKSLKPLNLRKNNYNIIGSAHSISEINLKKKQGCQYILFSKLFFVDYKDSDFLGINKFNEFANKFKNLIPLGGIKYSNLSKLKCINSRGFAALREVKKKPAFLSRLF